MKTLTVIAQNFINMIYPLRCLACGKDIEALDGIRVCGLCLSKIRCNPKPHCVSCGRPVGSASGLCPGCRRVKFHFDRAFSAYLYEDTLKELIHLFKYNSKFSLGPVLSHLLIDFARENCEIIDGADIITYVPLHDKRLREREFNQSKILAAHLASEFKMPLSDALKKTRLTKHQNELPKEARLTNLCGAFSVTCDTVAGKKILLIDDVMTTGATLNECAKALLDSGAERVRCLTLARAEQML